MGNTVRITKEQLSVLPGDYAKALEQFSTEINRQFKINNVSPETAKELRGNIQGLVREVRGVDEKRLNEDKRLKIKGRISTIIENILTVLPRAAETASTFTPLAPFSKLIGEGTDQVVKRVRERLLP